MPYYVYILSNQRSSLFYVGITKDLRRRMDEHRSGYGSKFCAHYNINVLVYFETFIGALEAIAREKQIKKWPRRYKITLIRKNHPRFQLRTIAKNHKYLPKR